MTDKPIAEIVAELRQAAIEEGHDVCVNGPSLLRLLAELERLQAEADDKDYHASHDRLEADLHRVEAERSLRVREIMATRKWTTCWTSYPGPPTKTGFVAFDQDGLWLRRDNFGACFTHPTDPWQPLLDAAAYFESKGR